MNYTTLQAFFNMARLRRTDADDAAFVDENPKTSRGAPYTAHGKRSIRTSPRKKAAKSYSDGVELSESDADRPLALQPKDTPTTAGKGKQRRLAPLHATTISRPLQMQPLLLPNERTAKPGSRPCNKSLFSRKLPSPAKKPVATLPVSDHSDLEETVEVEVEESIWCGSDAASDSEDELPSPRKFLNFTSKPKPDNAPKKPSGEIGELDLALRLQRIDLDGSEGDFQPQDRPLGTFNDLSKDPSRPTGSSDKENDGAILRFSPPRLYSPLKARLDRPVTPPQSPTKFKLQSPSKTKTRVPSPKLRQSLDAFWNAETVNDWNDQYSPRKVLKSPKKLRHMQEESSSPTASPRKAQSPTKRTKAERDAKQAFEDKKHAVAEAFLTELDETITQGKIRALSASTGGVRFIWSKTLNSTAGRANWRRETTKIRNPDGTTETAHKNHASIELAEKVINDEHRLLNVIAHEFCHLANFMISGIKDQPHGAQFKAYGRMCSKAFGESKGVEVTTKHSYEIEYKYVWQCSGEDCGSEFKRHSKSIDPKRHTCGSCRSKLVQVKPTPRGGATKNTNGKEPARTGFAAFVKLQFAATKASLPPGSSQKQVMVALGKAYKADKAAAGATGVQASSRRREDAGAVGGPEAEGVRPADAGRGDDDYTDGMERLAEGVQVIVLDDD